MNMHDAVVIGFYMHALKTDEKTGNARRAEQLQACIQLRVRDDDDGIDLYVHLKQLTLLIMSSSTAARSIP